ncbi:MAG: class I SAM-dependent methyltransferase [Nitrospirae bacterium]|nr:class I SAM-dependent methyltransferase [Nitrospirota bacterium]
MKKYDEGLGTVYERFMLNDYFERLMNSHDIKNILEVPFYGMTGLTGINSVYFAGKGCSIVLVDTKKENVSEAEKLLGELPIKGKYDVLLHEELSKLPFGDDSFDLVWNFAAIWHVKDADLLLKEMARVSSNLLLIFIPNKKQIGYTLRKYLIDRKFFDTVDESWINLDRITAHLKKQGMKIVEEGLIDIPFWPDTAIPVKNIFKRNIKKSTESDDNKSTETKKIFDGFWNWDIMSYYMGNNPRLKDKMEKLSFLEKMPLPKKVKTFWAHHLYILCSKQ